MLDLSRLSAEQQRVVLAGDGPLLVVAGPGSGKTTTLAARIAHLVADRGVAPAGVLAITFTTAATQTLRRRLQSMLGEPGGAVDVTTFHALGLRIVRHWSGPLGYTEPPVVLGTAATRALLREAAAAVGLDFEHRPLGALAADVERYRLRSATESARRGRQQPPPVLGTGRIGGLPALATAYETQLLRRNGVDYPAMLTLPLRAFERHPAALQVCRDAYRAILADEFQDLCGAQYALLRLLGQEHRNVIVVGDPRQTLYAWRGANSRFFRQFLADFPEAQVHVLDQNFRSTGYLVALANALGTALGYPRGLWTDNPAGQEALLYGAADEHDEAAYVAAEIARLSAGGQVDHLGEIAVLYRTNAQARTFVEALQARGLAHELVGGRTDADALAADTVDPADTVDQPASSTARDAVVLTTIHAAKGAEWRVVFVVGLEDGLLPHAHALLDCPDGDEPAGRSAPAAPARIGALEEELRVAYVAVTRPRERLYLTYCRTRQRGEWRQPCRPSRFFQALPAALIKGVGAVGSAGRVG